jgi:hypothetical protein
MRRQLSILIIAALLTLSAAALASATPPRFSRADLLEDFDRLSNTILSTNPLVFCDRNELSRFIASQREKVTGPMSELDFYRLLAPIVAQVRCGHTGVSLGSATESSFRAEARYLPLLVRIVHGGIFVLASTDGGGPAAGDEITAINGRPAFEIISALCDNLPADGVNLTRKLYVASHLFNELYTLFVDPSPDFRLSWRRASDDSRSEIDVKGITRADLEKKARAAGFPYVLPVEGEPFSFSAKSPGAPGTATLTVRTFGFFGAQQSDFRTFIDQAFDTMRREGTRALVLDLRGNWGGDPAASSLLFTHLVREPTPYFAEGTAYYRQLAQPMPPAANAFSGTLIVLTDGASFSSTGHLCSLLRFHGRATFVGEESGGSWTCTDGSRDTVLPHTAIRLRSSTLAFKTAVAGMPLGRGIVPDVVVTPEIGDLVAGRDPAYEEALKVASGAGER